MRHLLVFLIACNFASRKRITKTCIASFTYPFSGKWLMGVRRFDNLISYQIYPVFLYVQIVPRVFYLVHLFPVAGINPVFLPLSCPGNSCMQRRTTLFSSKSQHGHAGAETGGETARDGLLGGIADEDDIGRHLIDENHTGQLNLFATLPF